MTKRDYLYPWTRIDAPWNVLKLYEESPVHGAVTCRRCGALVAVEPTRTPLVRHADIETNAQWRYVLPDWAEQL